MVTRKLVLVVVFAVSGCQCGERVVGSGGQLLVEPSAIDFGTLRPGQRESRELVGTVSGRSQVTITSVSIEQAAHRPFATSMFPRTVNPGDEVRFFVEYAPQASVLEDRGVLVLETDASSGAVRIPLSGRMAEACSPRTACFVLEGVTPECGTQADGCGGSVTCGSCASGARCVSARCVPLPVDAGVRVDAGVVIDAGVVVDAGVCVATSCTATGSTCGTIADGCGGTLNCGTCAGGSSCQQNRCVCAGGTTEACGDGLDNNCDGNVDCADPQCSGLMACAQPMCTLTTPEVQVTRAPGNAYGAFLLSIPTGWAVFTHEDSNGTSSMRYSLSRLTPQLAPVGASTAVTNTGVAHRPYAAWNGTEFGLAWSDTTNWMQSNDVLFTRVSATGQRMLATDLPISAQPGLAFPSAIGWNGVAREFGVLWADDRTGSNTDRSLYFRRVDAMGQLSGAEVRLTPSPAGVTTDYGDLTWGGTNWGIVATQFRQGAPFMLFNRLSSVGAPEVADVQLNTVGSNAFQPRIGSSPTHYAAVFQEYAPGNPSQSDIVLSRLDKSGPANAIRIPVTSSHSATNASVIWAGSKWLVAFEDGRSGVRRVYLARFAADGTRLGGDELVSCLPTSAGFPHLAFDGTTVGVTFISTIAGLPQAFVKTFAP
ncbi:MAG: hypothetical protein Q8S33_17650 [Myxococcales bacterium]|nr:hypothetical protein [Myxococcales bacterium]